MKNKGTQVFLIGLASVVFLSELRGTSVVLSAFQWARSDPEQPLTHPSRPTLVLSDVNKFHNCVKKLASHMGRVGDRERSRDHRLGISPQHHSFDSGRSLGLVSLMASRNARLPDSDVDIVEVENIPLRPRPSLGGRDEQRSNDTQSDIFPDSDAAYLRRHRDGELSENGSVDTQSRNSTLFSRIAAFVMSRNPLLIRSSPALGTGSYGAVPVTERHNSVYESDSDGDIDDVRRRDRRKHNKAAVSRRDPRGTSNASSGTRRRRLSSSWSKLRRSSSNTSDIGMGLDSKASFASGGLARSESKDVSSVSGSEAGFSPGPSDDEAGDSDTASPNDNSPYPEVRASVPAVDNTTLSIDTPRMWTLSLLFALSGSATNLFFSLRYPSVAITPVIALVLVHPLGRLWDLALKRDDDPEESFDDGVLHASSPPPELLNYKSRFRLWLAQGRWNEKEHACVYISSNVSFGFAFATDVIVEQHKFYKQDVSLFYQILLTISTQILGYAFAGLTRRYLVRPAAMIWPGTLMSTAMFTTMHKQENKLANGWMVSRYRFFVIVWAAAFAWYFLPGLLMPALSYFSVITWFAPKNVVVANLVRNVQMSCLSRTKLMLTVWSGFRSWIIPYDIRLGTDCIHRLTTSDSMVGCRQCGWRSCDRDVDHGAHNV